MDKEHYFRVLYPLQDRVIGILSGGGDGILPDRRHGGLPRISGDSAAG